MIHDLRRREGFQPDEVERVELVVGLANFRNLAFPDPQDEMEARFSMQYCVARALYQDVLGLADFTPGAVIDPKIRALLPRITMSVLPEESASDPHHPAHRAILTLKDGKVLTASRAYARGMLASPLSEGMKRAKFVDCLGHLSAADAEGIYARLQQMDEMQDLSLIGQIISEAA